MIQTPLSPHCDCCGLPIGSQSGEDCPRCNYPVNLSKEERFLESNLLNLQRVVDYGGANLMVSGLIRRYGLRLTYLRKLKSGVVTASPAAPQPTASPMGKQAEVVLHQKSPAPPQKPPSRLEPLNSPEIAAMSAMPAVSAAPVQEPQRPPRRTFTFSWKSFVVDQAITIIGLLGAFLILMGALSSVVTTGGNAFLSFLIVFGVHAFFGIAGVVAYRFVNFRLIARIYTGIYTFLVPLVGFTGYNLVLGTHIPLTVPTLVAIAAGYAAIVYVLLAVYERFPIYAYLGGMALIVTELAIAADLHLDFWWWPSMLLLLAFPALISIARTPANGRERFFTGSLLVLRQPVRVLMFTIAGASFLGLVGTILLSFVFDSSGAFASVSGGAIRFSILSMTVLLLLWTSILLWLTKRTQGLLVLAYMLLACVLAFCYAFHFSLGGYVLALAGVALLYHGLSRFATRLLMPFEKLGLNLDLVALVLISIVPFVSSLQLPQQLIFAAYQIPVDIHSPLYVQANWDTVAGLIVVGVGLLITVSVALYRAKLHIPSGEPTKQHNDWPWLFLLSGFLLTWEYSTIVLALHITPVWYFVGLTFVLAGIAVLVRERFGASWANPLDIIVLSEIVLTLVLSLGQGTDRIAALLLGFAILTYGVLLYQRRHRWLFLPLTFAVLAVPLLIFTRSYVLLLIGLSLPLVSVAMRRIMANRLQVVDLDIPSKPERAIVWEWPLLAVGLLYGVVASLFDVLSSGSTVSYWFYMAFHVPIAFPVALEMVALALAWYLSAALARVKWWLNPVVGFAIAALLIPSNSFWVLVTIAPVAALLAFGISRASERVWASPLYIVALFSAVMAGIAGYQNAGQLFAASWILLGFGLFAYVMGLAEDLEPCLWLLPAFATWSLIDAAQSGDLYRPPTVALVFAGAGVAIGLLNLVPMPFLGAGQRNRLLGYALPFYATAFAAAVLTGVYGMLPGANPPFYGAIPDALLIYALTAFGVLLFERQPRWLWLVAGFGIWGTLLAPRVTIDWVVGIAVGAVLIGLLMGRIIRQPAMNITLSVSGYNLFKFNWGWPWYAIALVATIMMGVLAPSSAGAWALLVFALLAYIVGVVEDLPGVLWLMPVFAAWSLIDFAQLNQFYPLPIVVLVSTTLGLVTRLLNLSGAAFPGSGQKNRRLNYALPLYLTALAAAALTGLYFGFEVNYPFYGAVAAAMLLYAAVACIVMLFERVPEMLVLPAGFAALALRLWQPQLDIASLMIVYGIAYSMLCVLIFASQFVWKVLLPSTRWVPASLLHNILGIGGQLLVVLVILGNNGLFAGSDLLTFEGAGALFVLAAMVFCYGRIQGNNVIQRACDYTAGLLVSLVISWVLAAFRQTNLDLLLLAPATYLIVIAPLLLRDETLPQHQRIGQVIAVVGAALLLLPTLWLSFSYGDGNLLYTIVLMGEAMVLLLLGIGLGVRSFVLSGTGLIVVGAIHALFLTTNGLPWTLTLIITGVTLLAIATALSIAGRRLRAAWANWD
ncbi:MAG TPA: hypothetical protein VK140_03815 [Ktedonobacteraceae bacterium]|nr:hypothetical protein [Ktedonobacteraceae bacterium]